MFALALFPTFLHAQGGRTVITPMESSRNVITNDSNEDSSTPIYQGDDDKLLWQRIQEEKEAQERAKKEKAEAEQLEKERLAREKFVADSLERVRLEKEKAEFEKLNKEQKQQFIREKKEAEKHEKEKKHAEWVASIPKSKLFLVNVAYSSCPQYSFGLTYGHVRRFGWYVNVMSNFGFRFSGEYESNDQGRVNGVFPFYSGTKTSTYLSTSLGALIRLHIPLYLYGGVGYGYRGLFYELATGEWASCKVKTASQHALHWEAGLLCKIKGFALSGGVSSTTNFYANFFEAKIGIGYFINKK